jgi:hypothetical protein
LSSESSLNAVKIPSSVTVSAALDKLSTLTSLLLKALMISALLHSLFEPVNWISVLIFLVPLKETKAFFDILFCFILNRLFLDHCHVEPVETPAKKFFDKLKMIIRKIQRHYFI